MLPDPVTSNNVKEMPMSDSKRCSDCGQVLSHSKFYRDKRTSDGFYSNCKRCHKKLVSRYRKTPEGRVVTNKYKSRTDEHWKNLARKAVQNAVRSGRVVRPDHCSQCLTDCKPDGHHESYDHEHRLDVVWLCRRCHVEIHLTK